MSDEPERVFCKEGYDAGGRWGRWYLNRSWGGTEYVRADRIEALEAQLAEADARANRLAEMVRDEAAGEHCLAAYSGDDAMDAIHSIDPRALLEKMKEEE